MVFIWGERRKPEPGSWIRTFVITNIYAVLMSFFDVAFKTNYFFLFHKPAGRTMLDYFGPWPFYIVTVDIFAFVLFWLLHLPFKSRKSWVVRPLVKISVGFIRTLALPASSVAGLRRAFASHASSVAKNHKSLCTSASSIVNFWENCSKHSRFIGGETVFLNGSRMF